MPTRHDRIVLLPGLAVSIGLWVVLSWPVAVAVGRAFASGAETLGGIDDHPADDLRSEGVVS